MANLCVVMMAAVLCSDHSDCCAKPVLVVPDDPCHCINSVAVQRYRPQTGDLILFKFHKRITQVVYKMFRAGGVTHVSMVVRRPNGTLALLDAPGMKYPVMLNDVGSRLQFYNGKMWVRRIRCPLTARQSACLTEFACGQIGKKFHFIGLVVPTFGSPRRNFGIFCSGPAGLQSKRWFCSSLTVAAAVAGGLLDPCKVRPRFTNPQDLFADEHIDLSCLWERPIRLHRCGPRAHGWWSEDCEGCRRYWE